MNSRKLTRGVVYGTKANDVYTLCCEWFGWNRGLTKEFGMMKPLFAHRGADNGSLDVWMICHSNWYADILIDDVKSGTRKHRNYIHADLSRIDEFQQNAPFDDIYPLQNRITFAKNKKGQYVFLGVYRAKDPNSKSPDREFCLVSESYPTERDI